MLVLFILSQTQLQVTGSAGFRAVVPSEWSFYQEEQDRGVADGPLWGFDGKVRSGQFGVAGSFLTASYGKVEIHDNETGDVREDTTGDISRHDFGAEIRFYPSDLYVGFLYSNHSEHYSYYVLIADLDVDYSTNVFGLSVGYDPAPRHLSLSPYGYGSLAYATGSRKTSWITTESDDGNAARFMGEAGLAYYYKPIYLSLGFMGQAFVASFGDDSTLSHSNLWGLFFGMGAYF